MQDEMNFDDLSPADRELESALAGVHPARVEASRDDLLFRAGAESCRQSMRIKVRAWQSLVAALLLSTTVSMMTRPQRSGPTAMPVGVGSMAVATPSLPVDPYSAIALRDAVLSHGWEALPSFQPTAAKPTRVVPSASNLRWQ